MSQGVAPAAVPVPRTAKQRRNQFFSAIFMLALAGVMIWGLWSRIEIFHELNSSGRSTEAVVAGYETRHGRRETFYHPVLRFTTADGQPAQATSYTSNDPAIWPRGTRLPIVHAAADPTRAMPAQSLADGPGLTAWVLGIMATFCLAIGGLILWAGLRKSP